MKLQSGVNKRSRQERAIKQTKQNLAEYLKIQEENGKDHKFITEKGEELPIHKKIERTKTILNHQEKALKANSKYKIAV